MPRPIFFNFLGCFEAFSFGEEQRLNSVRGGGMTRLISSARNGLQAICVTGLFLLAVSLPFVRLGGAGVLHAQSTPIILDTLKVQVGSRVSSGLPVLTRSVQLLGREEIESLPVRTLSDLLDWATGVEIQSRSPAQSDLGIRGAGFEQVVVLVNGVRMSDPQTGHFD